MIQFLCTILLLHCLNRPNNPFHGQWFSFIVRFWKNPITSLYWLRTTITSRAFQPTLPSPNFAVFASNKSVPPSQLRYFPGTKSVRRWTWCSLATIYLQISKSQNRYSSQNLKWRSSFHKQGAQHVNSTGRTMDHRTVLVVLSLNFLVAAVPVRRDSKAATCNVSTAFRKSRSGEFVFRPAIRPLRGKSTFIWSRIRTMMSGGWRPWISTTTGLEVIELLDFEQGQSSNC